MLYLAVSTEYRRVTDRQTNRWTDTLPRQSPRYAYASRGRNVRGCAISFCIFRNYYLTWKAHKNFSYVLISNDDGFHYVGLVELFSYSDFSDILSQDESFIGVTVSFPSDGQI